MSRLCYGDEMVVVGLGLSAGDRHDNTQADLVACGGPICTVSGGELVG